MKYYLTTPIYYVNAAPHIGHAYTTIVADLVKRFKRMQGYDAVLTTGSDEHGVNVERAALRTSKTPLEFCDVIAAEFQKEWKRLGLEIDCFQRTTSPQHARVVQDLFERCRKNGYIYKGSYTGQYCIYDNLYVNEAKPGDPCPDCGRPTETITEENFFFKLSAFQDRLLELYNQQFEFIQPETRRNEVIAFVKAGLSDLSITRTNVKWGIPVQGEAPHVFYVWFDALATYMSAVDGKGLWPADLHLIGKEIVRFHAIYWPAFLMAAGLELPKRIFAHGWLLFEESKMSKSRGNIVRPEPIRQVIGVDALRYFLLREVVFGQDGNFSYDALVTRYNADLANGLGNLASRTAAMIEKNCGGKIPKPGTFQAQDELLAKETQEAIGEILEQYEALSFARVLELIWGLIAAADKYLTTEHPWSLGESEGDQERRATILWTTAEVLRVVTVLAHAVLPESTAKVWSLLGQAGQPGSFALDGLCWGTLSPGTSLGRSQALFPRIEKTEAIERMEAMEEEARNAPSPAAANTPAPASTPVAATGAAAGTAPATAEKIGIEDFAKIEMRVGQIKTAERIVGADKLLKLTVDIGTEIRQICAGIAQYYEPEKLIGRKVAVVVNLAPRKLRGVESNGMIVAATVGPEGRPVLAGFPDEDVEIGARLK